MTSFAGHMLREVGFSLVPSMIQIQLLLAMGLNLWITPVFAAASANQTGQPLAPLTISLTPPVLPEAQASVVKVASELLEQSLVSYVYGGYQIGDGKACEACNSCLENRSPRPSQRLSLCPVCRDCSLDCSHFIQLVFGQAGHAFPYLETAAMLALPVKALEGRYHLTEVALDSTTGRHALQVGDFLVYKGHVVILERLYPLTAADALRGDVVHATGGRDIRAPGQGIQRERYADLGHFRGPLLRVLRHLDLQTNQKGPRLTSSETLPKTRKPHGTSVSAPKLRPVQKRGVGEP